MKTFEVSPRMTQVSEEGKAYYSYIQRLITRLVTRRGPVKYRAVGGSEATAAHDAVGRVTGRSSKEGLG